jgi:hypothetical protein
MVRGSEPDEVGRMSDNQLREFVQGVLSGTLFLSVQVHQQRDIPVVFMPLALGALTEWSEEKLKDVGVFYARMSAALPRSYNGNPMFTEVRFLHKDDWARASKTLSREWSRWQDLEV